MMSKKDYEAIAEILHNYREFHLYGFERTGGFNTLIDNFCFMLKSDNPNFSKDRFKGAVFTRTVNGKRHNL